MERLLANVVDSMGQSTVYVTATADGRLLVEPLGYPVDNVEATATATVPSTAIQLQSTAKRVALRVDTAGAVLFAFGSSQADANSRIGVVANRLKIFAGQGDDFAIPPGMTHLTYQRAGSTDVAITVVELT